MRYLIDDPDLSERGPGEELAIAVGRAGGGDAAISVNVPLTTRFPLLADRRRPPLRDLMKTARTATPPQRYVSEARGDDDGTSATAYGATPEARFQPHVATAGLADLSVSVPVPDEIRDDPVLLARFVDHRVIVRMCTAENELLLHGSADGTIIGLRHLPGLRHVKADTGDPLTAITDAAAEVEEMGGSCDALVMHPRMYWRLVNAGALPSLDAARLRITRTRMIEPHEVLLGDFHAGVTLIDGGAGELALRRGPDGAAIEARMSVGLAVHLPQHFVLLTALDSP
jgi:hypothetical protein